MYMRAGHQKPASKPARMEDKPGIHLHFEMGVSWRPRNSRTVVQHGISYPPKNSRAVDRSARQRRQLPPAASSFVPGPTQQISSRHQPSGYPLPNAVYSNVQSNQHPQHYSQTYTSYHHNQQQQPQQQTYQPSHQPQHQAYQQYNQSMNLASQRPPLNDRGHSAPPPFHFGSYDDEPEPMSSTALPTQSSRPQVWKALPPNPAEFRLGEDAMPWSASPYAQGYMGESSTANGPDLLGFTPIVDDREKVRRKEMQSLATALMTVDNGFEDQWWYQGSRLVNIAGDLITPTALAAKYQSEMASAWPSAIVESPITGTADMFSPSQNSMYMVSPISAGPSPVADHPGLKRSLSTRSEELHIR